MTRLVSQKRGQWEVLRSKHRDTEGWKYTENTVREDETVKVR